MMDELKLFVWEEVLCDWGCGIVFALAHNVDEAREIILNKTCDEFKNTLIYAMSEDPKVFQEPVGFYVWGGS